MAIGRDYCSIGICIDFGTLANWIAAPFNGLLAQSRSTSNRQSLGCWVDRAFQTFHELWCVKQKITLLYPRAMIFIVLFFVPVVGQVLWFLFNVWMMALQYIDYPFDNHKVGLLNEKCASTNKPLTFQFGIMVSIFSLIPIVNFIVMPIAVCGATALWVDEYKAKYGQ